jgi:ATP-dependent Lhr-like helicase
VALPPAFLAWFRQRGWRPRRTSWPCWKGGPAPLHPPDCADGAGKTLAGFLPSLVALSGASGARRAGIHTLYISPLKALAVDVQRNLLIPLEEMALPIRVETRTGDTSLARKARQRRAPPDILLTTPEQVALLLSHADAPRFSPASRP